MGHGHGHVALERGFLLEHQTQVEAPAENAGFAAVFFLVGVVIADAQGRADVARGQAGGFLVAGFRPAFHSHGQRQHDALVGEAGGHVQGERSLAVADFKQRAVGQHAPCLAEHHFAEAEVLFVDEKFREPPGIGGETGSAQAQLRVHIAILLLKMHRAHAHAFRPNHPFRKHPCFSREKIRYSVSMVTRVIPRRILAGP